MKLLCSDEFCPLITPSVTLLSGRGAHIPWNFFPDEYGEVYVYSTKDELLELREHATQLLPSRQNLL